MDGIHGGADAYVDELHGGIAEESAELSERSGDDEEHARQRDDDELHPRGFHIQLDARDDDEVAVQL